VRAACLVPMRDIFFRRQAEGGVSSWCLVAGIIKGRVWGELAARHFCL
jgi:hypothetical protein